MSKTPQKIVIKAKVCGHLCIMLIYDSWTSYFLTVGFSPDLGTLLHTFILSQAQQHGHCHYERCGQ